jgi:hypothetical protein
MARPGAARRKGLSKIPGSGAKNDKKFLVLSKKVNDLVPRKW